MKIEWIAMSELHTTCEPISEEALREFLVNDDVIYDATQILMRFRTLPAFKFLVRLHLGRRALRSCKTFFLFRNRQLRISCASCVTEGWLPLTETVAVSFTLLLTSMLLR